MSTPREQLTAALNDILRHHDHQQDAQDLDVDSIIAVIKGLPAMQEADASWQKVREGVTSYKIYDTEVAGGNAKIRQILAELEGGE
jgi:hypothetical protein